jgi:hypothetical protein
MCTIMLYLGEDCCTMMGWRCSSITWRTFDRSGHMFWFRDICNIPSICNSYDECIESCLGEDGVH